VTLSSFVGLRFFNFLMKPPRYRDPILCGKSYFITSFTCSLFRTIADSEVCLNLGSGWLLQKQGRLYGSGCSSMLQSSTGKVGVKGSCFPVCSLVTFLWVRLCTGPVKWASISRGVKKTEGWFDWSDGSPRGKGWDPWVTVGDLVTWMVLLGDIFKGHVLITEIYN